MFLYSTVSTLKPIGGHGKLGFRRGYKVPGRRRLTNGRDGGTIRVSWSIRQKVGGDPTQFRPASTCTRWWSFRQHQDPPSRFASLSFPITYRRVSRMSNPCFTRCPEVLTKGWWQWDQRPGQLSVFVISFSTRDSICCDV